MNDKGLVIISPATFGYGPASHGISIARAIRRSSKVEILAIADGAAVPYLVRSGVFDDVIDVLQDALPDFDLVDLRRPVVFVAVTDFTRAIAAKQEGFVVVVVDALYWMWRSDPLDVGVMDSYLCLAFPGVSDRIAQLGDLCRNIKEIPQISEMGKRRDEIQRDGVIINLGGGTTPFGFSYDYAAALVRIVQGVLIRIGGGRLLVVCSEAARYELQKRGVRVEIESLSLDEMMSELQSRGRLVTLPGLSIMWDAVHSGIPTFVVPGISYSQHQLVKQYIKYFKGVEFFTWDDLPDYTLLPLGMNEDEGVEQATRIADHFARDERSQYRLVDWLELGFSRDIPPPTLTEDHPWGDFTGAAKVAEEVVRLLSEKR